MRNVNDKVVKISSLDILHNPWIDRCNCAEMQKVFIDRADVGHAHSIPYASERDERGLKVSI